MDKINMKNLAFFGYHGVLEEETKLGQKFFVDATLFLDTRKAGEGDDLTQSVSYADVYFVIKEVVEKKRFLLLEALAETITREVLLRFPLLLGIKVEVQKPEAPVPGIFDYMSVEITRMRDEEHA